jgi:hypothetical protein
VSSPAALDIVVVIILIKKPEGQDMQCICGNLFGEAICRRLGSSIRIVDFSIKLTTA